MKKLLVFFCIINTAILFAHPGRTDKNGGHRGPNGYHYHNSTTPLTSPSKIIDKQAFYRFYSENQNKALFENTGSRSWEIQTYSEIEGNSLKINMLFMFHDEKIAAERGEAIGRDCLKVMFAWLDKNRFKIPKSRGALYCFILNQARTEFWLVIMDEKTGEVVSEKRQGMSNYEKIKDGSKNSQQMHGGM